MTLSVSKLTGYAIVIQDSLQVSKLVGYAVIQPNALQVSKLVAYAVVQVPPDVREALTLTEPVVSGANPQVLLPIIVGEPVLGAFSVVRCPLIVLEVVGSIPEEGPVATDQFPIASAVSSPLGNPGLRGLTWSVKRTPMFVTDVNPSVNLKEIRTSRTEFPVWKFELVYDFLDQRDGRTELDSMAGFFLTMHGRWGAFLFQDPHAYVLDNAVLATGDAATTIFTVLRYQGAFAEPIGQFDSSALLTFPSTAVDTTTEAVLFAAHGMQSGYGPVCLTNPGAVPTGLTASQPYWLIAVDANHIAFAATKTLALAGTKINLTAQGSGTNTLSNTVAFFDNGTLVNFADYALSAPNEVIFDSAPANGHALTVSTSYFFQCRFEEDEQEYEEFMQNLYTLQSCTFRSII